MTLTVHHCCRQAFPLPGQYHFRAWQSAAGGLRVWLDLVEDATPVPVMEGEVVLKVTIEAPAARLFTPTLSPSF